MRWIGVRFILLALIPLAAWSMSCNSSGDNNGEACDPVAQTGCQSGQFCEEVDGGQPACFQPVTVSGTVVDSETGQPLAGVRVVALDANNSPVSPVAITDANGNYTLQVSVERNSAGTPVEKITLRADADDYQTFPGGVRPPFPIDLSQATQSNGVFVLDNALTDLQLVLLPPGSGTGSIAGTVQIPQDRTGVLIVAELSNGDPCPALLNNDCTSLAGEDGSFTIFNLPGGDYVVRAFVQGYSFNSVNVTLAEGQAFAGASLSTNGDPTATLAGKVNIVNPGIGQATSVILVLESTFFQVNSTQLPGVPVLVRGTTPPGLRVGDVTGDFDFDGVPAGNYVVLAAYEDDFLVRDPDTCIAGTDLVFQSFTPGQNVTLSNPFKITGALNNPSPDDNEVVGMSPVFTWEDDSSEDQYEVTVLDTFGTILMDELVPGSSGSDPSVPYAGMPLESGQFYQFHVFSVKDPSGQCMEDHAISQTEDLRGVFQVQ